MDTVVKLFGIFRGKDFCPILKKKKFGFLRIHTCTRAHMCVWKYVGIYVCLLFCMCIQVYTSVGTYKCLCFRMCVFQCVCVSVDVYM